MHCILKLAGKKAIESDEVEKDVIVDYDENDNM